MSNKTNRGSPDPAFQGGVCAPFSIMQLPKLPSFSSHPGVDCIIYGVLIAVGGTLAAAVYPIVSAALILYGAYRACTAGKASTVDRPPQ